MVPRVRAPALIVSGKQNTILPSIRSRRTVEKIANARHVEMPGAARLVPLKVLDAANTVILDLLRK
jgi:pimeloyl-ACP methyl ester carboxylesterase